MWLGLSVLDWVIVLAALLGIAAIGVAMSRRIHDRTDFFMGGLRLGLTCRRVLGLHRRRRDRNITG